ncbi:MAG: transcriptional regulator NrdR [Chloroflexota bacterium]|nr:transcriptional regulator NrdR [Chloroflexota bacterium]
MLCPNCGHADSRVTDSRDTGPETRRRRECADCGARFTTYERVQHTTLTIEKRDGRREEFDRNKLLQSVRLACVKRPLPTGALDRLADEIEEDLRRIGRAEVKAARVGEIVIERLRAIDPVAYIRYASVYRDFADLGAFIREIQAIETPTQTAAAADANEQLTLIPSESAAPPRPRARRGRRPSISLPDQATPALSGANGAGDANQ